MAVARSAPHRFSLADAAPVLERVSVGDAFMALEAQGLDDLVADDLEVYRLVMSPAAFKRLVSRLERAATEASRERNRAAWSEPELPFGTDVAAEARRERLTRRGPDGFLACWTVHTSFQIPGRLRLVPGREFSVRGVRGVRGRLRFRHAVTTDTGECWVDGWDRNTHCRSVPPEAIRVVHAKPKTRPRKRVR